MKKSIIDYLAEREEILHKAMWERVKNNPPVPQVEESRIILRFEIQNGKPIPIYGQQS